MATYSIEKLSGSTDGKAIAISGTTSGGANTIHTATANANDIDLIELYAYNRDADGEGRILQVSLGDTSVPFGIVIPTGVVVFLGRFLLMNSQVLSCWADEASDVYVYGAVMRTDK